MAGCGEEMPAQAKGSVDRLEHTEKMFSGDPRGFGPMEDIRTKVVNRSQVVLDVYVITYSINGITIRHQGY